MSELKSASEVAFNLQAELLAARSELAALREELAEKQALSEVFYQKQRNAEIKLANAERRNAALMKAISDAEYHANQGKVWDDRGCTYTGLQPDAQQEVLEALWAALKPTESGASECTPAKES